MAKAKKKLLPKDFEEMLQRGVLAELKAVFDNCALDARGGYSKQTALAYPECPDDLTRWLVEQGADIEAVDSHGETPLHARAGHWQGKIGLLLELGANADAGTNGRGTPLHRAAAVHNRDAVQRLIGYGAKVDARNSRDETPLAFALHQCSNAKLDSMAPIAEMLLAAEGDNAPSGGLFSRLFSARGKKSAATDPALKARVTEIGKQFEFHRADFNPDSVDAASAGLDRLYALFAVPPVPRRMVHDGKAPIITTAGRWEDRHQQLWEKLVPSSGAAATVQGEVIRISGRIHDELERNGGVNWDADYRSMADALLAHFRSGNPLDEAQLARASTITADVKKRRGDSAQLCALAVDWVALNPAPMALQAQDYRR
jgi:Ankyrin repeats (3 copies)